jgi:hypothetical protein
MASSTVPSSRAPTSNFAAYNVVTGSNNTHIGTNSTNIASGSCNIAIGTSSSNYSYPSSPSITPSSTSASGYTVSPGVAVGKDALSGVKVGTYSASREAVVVNVDPYHIQGYVRASKKEILEGLKESTRFVVQRTTSDLKYTFYASYYICQDTVYCRLTNTERKRLLDEVMNDTSQHL